MFCDFGGVQVEGVVDYGVADYNPIKQHSRRITREILINPIILLMHNGMQLSQVLKHRISKRKVVVRMNLKNPALILRALHPIKPSPINFDVKKDRLKECFAEANVLEGRVREEELCALARVGSKDPVARVEAPELHVSEVDLEH